MIKIGDIVICTWGSNKGKEFIVKKFLDNGNFSCILKDGSNNKHYEYCSKTTVLKEEFNNSINIE